MPFAPLRTLMLVTWKNPAKSRTLKSAAAVRTALESGEIAIKDSGIVINMPMLTWPGGKR